jgi:hypothetical protein
MASLVSPTPASLTTEVEDLRARVNHLASGLTRAQFNWQPDSGRKWSVGQCFDHLALANKLYLDAVTQAVDAAPPEPANRSFVARANALGGWFASTLEPSAGWRLKAPRAIQPASDLDPAHTLHRFDDSLARLVALIPRAWAIAEPNPVQESTRARLAAVQHHRGVSDLDGSQPAPRVASRTSAWPAGMAPRVGGVGPTGYGAERVGRIVRPTPASTHSIAITKRMVMASPRSTTAAAAVTTGTGSWTTAAFQAARAGSAAYQSA